MCQVHRYVQVCTQGDWGIAVAAQAVYIMTGLESPASYRVRLFDSCRISLRGREIALKSREQRLVALLALEGQRPRGYLAGMLWPETVESKAAASLRAAVWQLEHTVPGLVVSSASQLGLAAQTRVDVAELRDLTQRINAMSVHPDAVDGPPLEECLSMLLTLVQGELLTGWYEDWVLYERTRLQQLRLVALEVIADRLTSRGQTAPAMMAAMAAVAIEPLRESAHRAVIRVHLTNGNYNDAIREYRSFAMRMMRELGVRPSAQIDALVRPLLNAQRGRPQVGPPKYRMAR
jgi:DNA-binding SARP family transcriptional activator